MFANGSQQRLRVIRKHALGVSMQFWSMRQFVGTSASGIAAVLCIPGNALANPAMPMIPENLSIGSMFLQADWIVKLVMIGLLFASLVTWTVFIAKVLELRKANLMERETLEAVNGLRSLDEATKYSRLAFTPLVREAISELKASSDAMQDGEGIKERIVSRFGRHEA